MDWLNYHHLRYFWTVAREGSVTAAAELLGLSRPTVTAQIRALENAFKQPLFGSRGLSLIDVPLLVSGESVVIIDTDVDENAQALIEAREMNMLAYT